MFNELLKKSAWLKELHEEGPLEKTAKAQFPGPPCAFRAAAGTLPLIKNSLSLMIGPEICLYNAKLTMGLRSLTDEPLPNNLLLLLLKDQDIVFGVSEKIKAAIIDICEQHKPEVLFVVTTCLQEIIGEDFDSLIEETQQEVNLPLIGIHTDNFTCDSAGPGLENTSLALINLMKPQLIEKNAINILGLRIQKAYETELVHLLQSKGVKIKSIFPSICTPKELETAPAAEINLVMDQYSLPLAQEMEKRFGCKYIYCERSFTPHSIIEMYNKIAKALNINIGKEVQEKKKKVLKKIESLKSTFSGKTCVIGMLQGVQIGRYFNLAELMIMLGMEVKGMILYDILEIDLEDIQNLSSRGFDFPIINGGNTLQNDIFLKELKPSFYIGNSDKEHLAKINIEPKNLLPAFRKTGFSALDEVLRLLSTSPPGYETLLYKEQFLRKYGRE